MSELNRYTVIMTQTALDSLNQKALFIRNAYQDPNLAMKWFLRLRAEVENELSVLPYKYPVYNKGKWRDTGVHIFTIRNDVVLYEIDEEAAVVYVRNIFTRGKDLSRD